MKMLAACTQQSFLRGVLTTILHTFLTSAIHTTHLTCLMRTDIVLTISGETYGYELSLHATVSIILLLCLFQFKVPV
jgi:hypothetical protein